MIFAIARVAPLAMPGSANSGHAIHYAMSLALGLTLATDLLVSATGRRVVREALAVSSSGRSLETPHLDLMVVEGGRVEKNHSCRKSQRLPLCTTITLSWFDEEEKGKGLQRS